MKPKDEKSYKKTERYVVEFEIAGEQASKFFIKKEQAKTFATAVGGKITVYYTLERKGKNNGR